jgi:hypothetical protein
MTSHPVDLDTLADYLDDLLPPEERGAVADLVATDPAWSASFASLQAAQPQVIAALSAAAGATTPVPAEILRRVDGLTRPANVVDLGARRRSRANRALRSGWLKAAAALVVVVVGVGFIVQLAHSPTANTSTTSSAGRAFAAPKLGSRPGLDVSASGTDYTAADLAKSSHTALSTQVPAPAENGPAQATTPGSGAAPAFVPPTLRRLAGSAALNDCLTAVETLTGDSATSVDFALYQHDPALIIGFAKTGALVAVGPTCGEPGAGADVLGRG